MADTFTLAQAVSLLDAIFLVSEFPNRGTGKMVMLGFAPFNDILDLVGIRRDTVDLSKMLSEVDGAKLFEWTPMRVLRSTWVLDNDCTGHGLIIFSTTFQTIVVSEAISVIFTKLVVGYITKGFPPKNQCFLDWQANTLQLNQTVEIKVMSEG